MTGGDWEIVPEALTDLLLRLREGYGERRALGYELVHVDYETQARTVKDSGRAYAAVAAANALTEQVAAGRSGP